MNSLIEHISFEHTQNHLHLEFDNPHQVISSAVLNGGLVMADHFVNIKVSKSSEESVEPLPSPETTLSKYCENFNWHGTVVGMMTAASMDSFRIAKKREQGVDLAVLVTTGLSNLRRAGDHAEYRIMGESSQEIGTINIIVLTSATLTQPALIEALMVATEAKAAALQSLGVKSAILPGIATGTGTDAMAIVNGQGKPTVQYCGKHVLFGEILAKLVIEALTSSIHGKGE